MIRDILKLIILGETAVILALVIILLIILIWILLRKKVVVPTLTVATAKAKYLHGETVEISGALSEEGSPVAGQTIGVKIKYPDGTEVDLPDVTTDDEGKYANSWVVPSDAPPGTYTVTATGYGVSATTTFSHKQYPDSPQSRKSLGFSSISHVRF